MGQPGTTRQKARRTTAGLSYAGEFGDGVSRNTVKARLSLRF